jgi:hypothetical protein
MVYSLRHGIFYDTAAFVQKQTGFVAYRGFEQSLRSYGVEGTTPSPRHLQNHASMLGCAARRACSERRVRSTMGTSACATYTDLAA